MEGPRPVWNWAGTGAPGRGPQASVNPVALAGGGKAGWSPAVGGVGRSWPGWPGPSTTSSSGRGVGLAGLACGPGLKHKCGGMLPILYATI